MVEDSSAEYVVAKFDYEARESHELSIVKSERLKLISDLHNWWKVNKRRVQINVNVSCFRW